MTLQQVQSKRKLRIAQIAPLWFSIPPAKYGGTERIVHYLTEGLVKRGHKVTLFASGDSKTKAKLVSVTEKGLISRKIPWTDYTWAGLNTSVAFELANKFDVIHSHWGFFSAFFQKFVKTPVLHTFHNIPERENHRWKILNYYKKDLNAVFISQSEKKNSPIKFKKSWVVYNGIDLSDFKFNPKGGEHFIWLGRVEERKGIENAIEAAEQTGVKLLLAGQIQEMRRGFFEQTIKPHFSDKIKYLGELPQEKLSDFYGKAKALLYPIEWEEPFGLVMVEAMACGTPVIVFDRGSAREVVKHGKTGFVVNPVRKDLSQTPIRNSFLNQGNKPILSNGVKDINQMIKAMKKIGQINRTACRQRVEKLFTSQRMVDDYEKIYYKLIKSTNEPRTRCQNPVTN